MGTLDTTVNLLVKALDDAKAMDAKLRNTIALLEDAVTVLNAESEEEYLKADAEEKIQANDQPKAKAKAKQAEPEHNDPPIIPEVPGVPKGDSVQKFADGDLTERDIRLVAAYVVQQNLTKIPGLRKGFSRYIWGIGFMLRQQADGTRPEGPSAKQYMFGLRDCIADHVRCALIWEKAKDNPESIAWADCGAKSSRKKTRR